MTLRYDAAMDIGTTGVVRFTCDPSSTAMALGSGDVPVLGTPKVVALAEEAAVAALADTLDQGRTSVGTAIHLDHLAPTRVGSTVEATASVVSVHGRTVDFTVLVVEGSTVVATGSHTRVIVDRERFLAGASGRGPTGPG